MLRTFLPFRRSFFFDAPADNGGGVTTPPATTVTPPATTTVTPPATTTEVTFTPEQQEKVNTIVKERLGRHKTETTDELLKALGVANTEEAKKFVDSARQAELDRLSDLDKANKKATDAETKAQEAETKAQKALDRALMAEVKLEAAAQNFKAESYEDVFLKIDRTKITEKDGGFEGLKEAVEEVAKVRPFWLNPTDGKDVKKTPSGTPLNAKTVVPNTTVTSSQTGATEVVVNTPILRL